MHYSPTAECYGVFAQYRFRCVLGELGRFSGRNRVPGFRRWFQVSMGSDGFRFGKWLRFRRFRVSLGFRTCHLGFFAHLRVGNAVQRVNAFCVKRDSYTSLLLGILPTLIVLNVTSSKRNVYLINQRHASQ